MSWAYFAGVSCHSRGYSYAPLPPDARGDGVGAAGGSAAEGAEGLPMLCFSGSLFRLPLLQWRPIYEITGGLCSTVIIVLKRT